MKTNEQIIQELGLDQICDLSSESYTAYFLRKQLIFEQHNRRFKACGRKCNGQTVQLKTQYIQTNTYLIHMDDTTHIRFTVGPDGHDIKAESNVLGFLPIRVFGDYFYIQFEKQSEILELLVHYK